MLAYEKGELWGAGDAAEGEGAGVVVEMITVVELLAVAAGGVSSPHKTG